MDILQRLKELMLMNAETFNHTKKSMVCADAIKEIEQLRKDAERLEWCVKHSAMPMLMSNWNLWCVDFSSDGGKSWYDYNADECSKTMREAIDKARAETK